MASAAIGQPLKCIQGKIGTNTTGKAGNYRLRTGCVKL